MGWVVKQSNRMSDSIKEHHVAYLMDMLYVRYGYTVQRITDMEQQKSGLDVVLEKDGIRYLVDEKAALTRLDGGLKTFAFELASSNNYRGYGWFVNSSSKTEYYALIYLKSSQNSVYKLDSMQCVLLEKANLKGKVIPEIQRYGIHFNNIIDFLLDKGYYQYGKYYFDLNDNMRLVYSANIVPEHPVNVVINKQYLCDNCTQFLSRRWWSDDFQRNP